MMLPCIIAWCEVLALKISITDVLRFLYNEYCPPPSSQVYRCKFNGQQLLPMVAVRCSRAALDLFLDHHDAGRHVRRGAAFMAISRNDLVGSLRRNSCNVAQAIDNVLCTSAASLPSGRRVAVTYDALFAAYWYWGGGAHNPNECTTKKTEGESLMWALQRRVLIDVCCALRPLVGRDVYVMLETVDWLPFMHHIRQFDKVTLITRILQSEKASGDVVGKLRKIL
jgi:hypothetical protein